MTDPLSVESLRRARAAALEFAAACDATIARLEADAFDKVSAAEAEHGAGWKFDAGGDLALVEPTGDAAALRPVTRRAPATDRVKGNRVGAAAIATVREVLFKAKGPLAFGAVCKKSGLSEKSVSLALRALDGEVKRTRAGMNVFYELLEAAAVKAIDAGGLRAQMRENDKRREKVKEPPGVQMDTKPRPAISVPKCAEDMLLEIKFGAMTPEELQRKTGWPMQTVKRTLTELVDSGAIVGGFGGSAVRMKGTDA